MVKKDQEILHSGKIVDMTPETFLVEIESESACASCHAASLCGLSESKKKIVEVPAQLGFEPGEEVWVIMKRSLGMKAVTIAYVIPLIVLVVGLFAGLMGGLPEVVAGISAICAVALYYLIIYLRRDKLYNDYTFYIKKK
ncbi:MAG: SoxR reducing system RseC family protein [Bacteroidales bacterium]|nr:SoxR reducing system RseC family protein [Bacteroidales bacterium]